MAFFIDGHCDSAVLPNPQKLITGSAGQLDFLRLTANHKAQIFAFFLNERKYKAKLLEEMLVKAALFKQIVNNCEFTDLLLKKSDLAKNKVLALMSLEGVEVLLGRPELAEIFFDIGFRAAGLTWNNDNWAAGGCGGNNSGLTEAGYVLIEKLNELDMIIDLAHASPKTFREVIKTSKKPVLVSHSCCFSLHEHRRNLTNEQLRLLAEKGGICGINFYPEFLKGSTANIEDIVEHIHHAVNIAGLEQVGLGSDFDGIDELPGGMNGVQDLPKLAEALSQKGYAEAAVAKIMGGNWYRFLRDNLPY
ncbi:MAG: membrane dipeptidase [Clostridia bacterium]|nr:membrane dipeptidase [Clostridia bacterium]